MTALERLKTTGRQDSLLLLVSDPEAKRLAVAWQHYGPRFQDFEVPEDAEVLEILVAAWKKLHVDYELLAMLAGMDERLVEQKFPMLQRAQIVFPDGTISDLARRVLSAEVAGLVKKAAGE